MERNEEFQRGMTLGLIKIFIILIVVMASQMFLNIDQTTLKMSNLLYVNYTSINMFKMSLILL